MVERRLDREGVTPRGLVADSMRSARICRLLEDAAREGQQTLDLLVHVREVYGYSPGHTTAVGTSRGDAARLALLRDLSRQLSDVEREGSRRLERARALMRPAGTLRLVRS